jgi:hypothetical protein
MNGPKSIKEADFVSFMTVLNEDSRSTPAQCLVRCQHSLESVVIKFEAPDTYISKGLDEYGFCVEVLLSSLFRKCGGNASQPYLVRFNQNDNQLVYKKLSEIRVENLCEMTSTWRPASQYVKLLPLNLGRVSSEEASLLIFFDSLSLISDRTAKNPNMAMCDSKLFVYDFESGLSRSVVSRSDSLNSISNFIETKLGSHRLISVLQKTGFDHKHVVKNVANISQREIDLIFEELPQNWVKQMTDARTHLIEGFENAENICTEISRGIFTNGKS